MTTPIHGVSRREFLKTSGALDAGGNLVAWESEVFIPDRPSQIQVTLVATDLAQLPKEAAPDWASLSHPPSPASRRLQWCPR
jgi:hypothetical protein